MILDIRDNDIPNTPNIYEKDIYISVPFSTQHACGNVCLCIRVTVPICVEYVPNDTHPYMIADTSVQQ